MKSKNFFTDDDEILDIRWDNIFKAVFTKETPESQGALSRLISALIGYEVSVIKIVANEPPVDSLQSRQIRFDFNKQVRLNGRSRIITLELSKLDKVIEKPTDEMSYPELWAAFFQYLTDKSKRNIINEIMKKEEGIAMASEVLKRISKDEIEQARLLSELKYELDMQSRMTYAKNEERENIAVKMKNMGLSAEQIAEATGIRL